MTIVEQLQRDEGCVLHAYQDSRGIWTIGYGHNLEAHEQHIEHCTLAQAEQWLKDDLASATDAMVASLPWALALDDARFGCLQNMAFNVGVAKLLHFKKMLAAMEAGNYRLAAQEMANSLWAKQVGIRALRLEKQMYTGDWC